MRSRVQVKHAPSDHRSGRTLVLALLVCVSLLPPVTSSAQVASLGDVRSRALQIGAETAKLRATGAADFETEQALVERLGRLVLDFIHHSDQTARTAVEGKHQGSLRPAFEAIREPLNALYTARSDRLKRMARTIMDEDGDLEALYETPDWQQSQAVAAKSLYFLNWLNYYGARLYDGGRRRELLQAAEQGFSEFSVGDQRRELLTESLLGRGLCHLELDHYDWAIRDFRLVIDEPQVSAERKAKARLALLEAYVQAGKSREALSYSNGLLEGRQLASGDAALVRFHRLQALFDVLEQGAGAKDEQYRREASSLMDQLRRAGGGWSAKVDALMISRVDDPTKWIDKVHNPKAQWELAKLLLQKDNYEQAEILLKDIAGSDRADAKLYRGQVQYWLGVSRFKAGDYHNAAQRLEAALDEPNAEFASDAAYLRFKALEAMMAQEANPELADRYGASLRDLLQGYPEHPSIDEVQYRLAEYLQTHGSFEEAIQAYEKVTNDPGFALRARFGSVQSAFELLGQKREPVAREELLSVIAEELERFWQLARTLDSKKDSDDVPLLQELSAKATILQAVFISLRQQDGDAEVATLLEDFPQRFPGQQLVPQALRLRLAALCNLGRFGEAQNELSKHADALAAEGRNDAIEQLASSFVKAAARREADGHGDDARSAQRVALRLYELLDTSDQGDGSGRRLTVARLYESTGDEERAAALYRQVLRDGDSLQALSGLARISEGRHRPADALSYWTRYTEAARPGDLAWYRGNYEQARLALATGDQEASCRMLDNLRPAMPGLSDAELRGKLNELYDQACG